MAIDIERLVPLQSFRNELGQMIKELTALQPADGFDRVYFPGELEGIRREQRLREGIPIERGLCQELTQLGARFGIPFPGPR